MGLLNNIKIELVILLLVTFSIFITFDLDYIFYNYFKEYGETNGGIYLKKFFVDITVLGSSLWYFAISIIGSIFFYYNKKFQIIKIKIGDKLTNFFILSFFYILIVGAFTQIAKHIIGRPRPNYTNFENFFHFKFFTLESNFHSYPSGHTSTIFMVCFILVAAFPKLKYFFIFLASIVGLSRIIVGAHFFTDVVAGALLSLIIFKILNGITIKKYNNYKFSKLVTKKSSELFYYLIFLFISCVFITTSSALDLFVSGLFYQGESQFVLQSYDLVSILFRDILLPAIIFYILILPIVGRFANIDKIFFSYKFSIKEILLLWASQIICLLIFVNLILKNFWGRARPNDVIDLGGKENFSPWFEINNACQTNCSFVSGDASVGFSFIILYLITKKLIFLYASAVAGFVFGLIRIMAGGHFLSDIFFAGFFIVILNIILFELYKKYYAK